MGWRTGPEGYGWISKTLHWLTVLLLTAQFAVGWSLDLDDGCDPPGEDRSGGDTSDAFEERLDRLEDACEASADQHDLLTGTFGLPEVHLALGLTILAVAGLRLVWRRHAGLPPWSEALSARQRQLAHVTERALLTLLFAVPLSGILLHTTGHDFWLPIHVATQLAFLGALVAHLATNLRPRVLRRMV